MSQSIQVSIRNVYGQEMVYPACPKSTLLAALTGKRTLTPFAIDIIKELGFSVEVVQAAARTL